MEEFQFHFSRFKISEVFLFQFLGLKFPKNFQFHFGILLFCLFLLCTVGEE